MSGRHGAGDGEFICDVDGNGLNVGFREIGLKSGDGGC